MLSRYLKKKSESRVVLSCGKEVNRLLNSFFISYIQSNNNLILVHLYVCLVIYIYIYNPSKPIYKIVIPLKYPDDKISRCQDGSVIRQRLNITDPRTDAV